MSNPLVDMEKPDVIFCIGTNMTECHPVAATRLKKAVANGAKLVVADPRRIALAEMSDLYLPLRVGSDVALLLGMAHVIEREGLVDDAFMHERTAGFEEYLQHVRQFTPQWAESITGVPAADIEQAARWYGAAERGAIYYTLGITEHICGVDNVQSLCNLALMTGHIGREGTGINPMRGQNNIQGAGDAGAVPSNYPGFQAVDQPDNQAKFEKLYGRPMDAEKGITKVRALEGAGEHIFAMLIDGENTLVSDPDRKHCERALNALEHLVVIDIFLTETAELADVVLPPLHGPRRTASAPIPNAEFNGCVRPSPRPARQNRTGGLSHRSPSASALMDLSILLPKTYSMSFAACPRSMQASTGTGSSTASISGPCLIRIILARRFYTRENSKMDAAFLK